MRTKAGQMTFDVATYAVLGVVIGLCAVGAWCAYPGVAPMVVSILAGLGTLGILVGILVARARFKYGYNYWSEQPVRVGMRGRPCWDQWKVEQLLEAVVRFWSRKMELVTSNVTPGVRINGLTELQRKVVVKVLDGITVWCRRDPWSSFGRMVVGLASSEAVAVRYEHDITQSALAHELGHVIIGKVLGHWDEKTSHALMDKYGFTRLAVQEILDEIEAETASPEAPKED